MQDLKHLRRRVLFLSAALPLALAAQFAPAPAAAQQSEALEEVIVTAQKREESLQEAPLAVTAFTQRDLEDLGAVEFGAVANKAPNITLRKQSGSHANYAFGIRGVAAGETALAVDSVVGLYVDGVYLGRLTGSAFDISDTERVEVLRGPQGTLYGRNAVAGAINIISNKPKEEFEFRNYLTAGERGLLRNQTTVNSGDFPVAGGKMSARFNFSKWEFDGLVERSNDGKEIGDIDSDAARLALRWESRDGVIVDYKYDYSDKTGNSQISQITGVDITGGVGITGFTLSAAGGAGVNAAQAAVLAVQPGPDPLPPGAPAPTPEQLADARAAAEAAIARQIGEAAEAGGTILALGEKARQGAALSQEEQAALAAANAVTGAPEYSGAFINESQRVGRLLAGLQPFPIYKQAAAAANPGRSDSLPVLRSQAETSEIEAHSLNVEWEMPSGVIFRSITSYREWDSRLPNFGNDFGTFAYEGPQNAGASVNDQGVSNCRGNCVYQLNAETGKVELASRADLVSLFNAQRKSDQEQFTQEFQFNGESLDGRLSYVAGFYYFQEEANEENPQRNAITGPALPFFGGLTQAGNGAGQGSYHTLGSGAMCGDPNIDTSRPRNDLDNRYLTLATFGAPLTLAEACLNATVLGGGGGVFNYGTDNEAYALYWQGRYTLDDRTNVTLGLRYTRDDKEAYLESVPVFSAKITSSTMRVSDDDSWNKFTWDISVDHQWTDEINLYGRVATSYRAGGYNVRIDVIDNFADPVDEENILSYELGAKTQWFDNRLRVNLTLFYADYEDKQTSSFSPSLAGATSIISNFGEQTNQGVELEALAIPAPGWTLGLNYGYTDVEIKKAPLRPDQTISDLAPPYTPETTAYAWAQYEFAPSDYGTLSIRVDYDYADKFTISAESPLNSPANRSTERALWGARISLADIPLGGVDRGQLSVALWGRNLRNEEYREFVIPFGTFDAASYGELRSYGMDIIYDY